MPMTGAGNGPHTGQLQVFPVSAGTAEDLLLPIRKDGAWRWYRDQQIDAHDCQWSLEPHRHERLQNGRRNCCEGKRRQGSVGLNNAAVWCVDDWASCQGLIGKAPAQNILCVDMHYSEGVEGICTRGRWEGPQVRKQSDDVCLSASRPLLRPQLAGFRGFEPVMGGDVRTTSVVPPPVQVCVEEIAIGTSRVMGLKEFVRFPRLPDRRSQENSCAHQRTWVVCGSRVPSRTK